MFASTRDCLNPIGTVTVTTIEQKNSIKGLEMMAFDIKSLSSSVFIIHKLPCKYIIMH